MLTPQDLKNIDIIFENRIAIGIGELVTNHIQPLKNDVDGLKVELRSLGEDVNQLKFDSSFLRNDLDQVKIDMHEVKQDAGILKKDMRKVKKDLTGTIRFFDLEYLETKNRVERIEDHLHLPPIS